eukprot:PhM_4_TR356/c1_g1_i1/m.63621/K00826/E2.6.1.42, ilvE; branched-chain amino acid aminotransferase
MLSSTRIFLVKTYNTPKATFVASEVVGVPAAGKSKPMLPPLETIKFGQYFSPHILQADWEQVTGWGRPYFTDFHTFKVTPTISGLQYGLTCFEGLKAYHTVDNRINLFRPDMNAKRMLRSCEHIALPSFDEKEFVELIKLLVRVENGWVPRDRGYSLYVRPCVVATDPVLGLHTPTMAKFFILLSPVGPYYSTGLKPVKLIVEETARRAWPGGSGNHKVGGNYAPTIPHQKKAEDAGFQQVLWLGPNDEVTEVGAMNIFFVFKRDDGKREVVTASLDSGMILPGVTRDSMLTLLRQCPDEFVVSERDFTIHEVIAASKEGRVAEVFGAGTAAVVSPVDGIRYKDTLYEIPNPTDGVAARLLRELTDIQYGMKPHEWSISIDE